MFGAYYDWVMVDAINAFGTAFLWIVGVSVFVGVVLSMVGSMLDWEDPGTFAGAGAILGLGAGIGWPVVLLALPLILAIGVALAVGWCIGASVRAGRARKKQVEKAETTTTKKRYLG